jgi:putative transposase
MARMSDVQPNGKTFFRFWQRGGGYDKNVDYPRDIWDLIDYIHNNPVRRGLVTRAEDWLWSSAADHLLGRPGKVRLHRDSVPRDLRQLGM